MTCDRAENPSRDGPKKRGNYNQNGEIVCSPDAEDEFGKVWLGGGRGGRRCGPISMGDEHPSYEFFLGASCDFVT